MLARLNTRHILSISADYHRMHNQHNDDAMSQKRHACLANVRVPEFKDFKACLQQLCCRKHLLRHSSRFLSMGFCHQQHRPLLFRQLPEACPILWCRIAVLAHELQQSAAGAVRNWLCCCGMLPYELCLLKNCPGLSPLPTAIELKALLEPLQERRRHTPSRHEVRMLCKLILHCLHAEGHVGRWSRRCLGYAVLSCLNGGDGYAVKVHIVREQVHWLDAAFDCDAVHLPHPTLERRRQQLDEVPADQDGAAELLGSRLQPRCHVHVGRQIGSVNLELGANGALDSPADVQAEPHLHLIARHSLEQVFPLAERLQTLRPLDSGLDDHKSCQRPVSYFSDLPLQVSLRVPRQFAWSRLVLLRKTHVLSLDNSWDKCNL